MLTVWLSTDDGALRPFDVTVEVTAREMVGGHLFCDGAVDIVAVTDKFTGQPATLSPDEMAEVTERVTERVTIPTVTRAGWW